MKNFYLIILSAFLYTYSFAQSAYTEVKLEEKSDYKSAEATVLKASTYLFTTRFDKDNLERLYAIQFIMKWMEGTPDYTFIIDEKFARAFVADADLLGLYVAAMTKYALENKEQAGDATTVSLNAIKIIIEYSSKPGNNLKQTGELKKMAAALKKGELEKYLGI